MNPPSKAFWKAVLAGTLAGGLPPMTFTLPLAVVDLVDPLSGERRLIADIYLAGLPLWISFAVVLASSLVVGIPTHLAVQKLRTGSRQVYVSLGALAGFAITLTVLLCIGAVAGFWTVLLGAFSGAMTGLAWWKSLESSLRSRRQ